MMSNFTYNIQNKLSRQQNLKIEMKLTECFNTDTIYVRKTCTESASPRILVTNLDFKPEILCEIPVEEPYNTTPKYINKLVREIIKAIEV